MGLRILINKIFRFLQVLKVVPELLQNTEGKLHLYKAVCLRPEMFAAEMTELWVPLCVRVCLSICRALFTCMCLYVFTCMCFHVYGGQDSSRESTFSHHHVGLWDQTPPSCVMNKKSGNKVITTESLKCLWKRSHKRRILRIADL